MKMELIISKERVSYIVEELGAGKVTVSEYNEDQNMLSFELDNPLDVLYMFHAGIKYGSNSMSRALLQK